MKQMKSKLFALSLLLILASCNIVDDILTFSISNKTTITIKSSFPVASPFEAITPDVTTNSSAEFSNNKTKASLVKDVKLTSLGLTIKSPADKTFSFLKSIRLYISTNSSNEILLAQQENISSTSNTINLTCTPEKLDEYIKADTYKIRTEVTTKETLTQDLTIEANMRFKVTADTY
jgi:hypothetical protein